MNLKAPRDFGRHVVSELFPRVGTRQDAGLTRYNRRGNTNSSVTFRPRPRTYSSIFLVNVTDKMSEND